MIFVTVSNNFLYILKIQVGDKWEDFHWFKGVKKDAEGTYNSFLIIYLNYTL